MADTKKKGPEEAAAHPAPAGAAGQPQESINKMDLIRKAMAVLGNKTKTAELRKYVNETFKLDPPMTASHVSAYRGKILEALRKKRAAAKKQPAAAPAKAEPTAAPAAARQRGAGKQTDLSEDIVKVEELVQRYGRKAHAHSHRPSG